MWQPSIAVIHSILVPQKIGVFVDSDSYIENFDIQCQVHTLKQRVQEFRIEQAIKEQELDQSAEIDARDAMLLDPDVGYADRFEAAIQDLAVRTPYLTDRT